MTSATVIQTIVTAIIVVAVWTDTISMIMVTAMHANKTVRHVMRGCLALNATLGTMVLIAKLPAQDVKKEPAINQMAHVQLDV